MFAYVNLLQVWLHSKKSYAIFLVLYRTFQNIVGTTEVVSCNFKNLGKIDIFLIFRTSGYRVQALYGVTLSDTILFVHLQITGSYYSNETG